MAQNSKYRWITDPAHGWLEVPLAEIEALGIGDKISPYSYRGMNGAGVGCAYLEEDCDAAIFIEASSIDAQALPDVYTDRDSWVRRLRPFN